MKKKSTISNTMKKRCGRKHRQRHNVQNGDTPTMMQNGIHQRRHHWNNGIVDNYTRFNMPHNTIPS